jgi:hypothetical protein
VTSPAARAARPELLAAIVAALLYLIWYPPTFGIIDESTYLSTAYVYRAGTIHADVAGVASIGGVESGGHTVAKFAPLWPLVLAPFTAAGWRGAFAANLLLYLAGFVLFARLVRGAGLPRWTALLYLAHPTLLVYARTLMSDVAAGVPVLAAWLLWRRGGRGAAAGAGFLLGVSVLVRYTNVILVVLFVIAAGVDAARHAAGARRRIGPLLLGGTPPAIVLAVYDQIAFGTWWRGSAGYRDDRAGIGMSGQFGWQVLGSGLEHYVTALLVVLPLLLLGVLLYRGRDRVMLRIVTLGFTLFFCFYYYRDRGEGFLATAVVGQRFLIPVLPLYLLAYAEVLDRAVRAARVPGRWVGAGVAAAALAVTVAVHVRHDAALRAVDARRRALYAATEDGAVVLCDTEARKLLHDVWGARTPVRVEFRGRWEIPAPAASGAGAPVFLALGDDGEPPPELKEMLATRRAVPVPVSAPDLRVWSLPGPG